MADRISRRTVLRGVGASLALPLLDAMVPNSSQAAGGELSKPPVRSAFLFMPNGVVPKHWDPPNTDDESFELTPMLKPLAKVKEQILLINNLWNEKTVGRNGHWPKVPAFLSGGFVERTAGRDISTGGTSLDQVMAQKIGSKTPLPTLELGVDPTTSGVDNIGGGFTRVYGSHIAWRDPHTPVEKEIVPRLAFDRLFRTNAPSQVVSGFNPNHPAVLKSLQADDTSVLDLVLEDAKSLQRKVGKDDRSKIDEYLESVRSVEKRIEVTMKPQKRWINKGDINIPRPGPGIPREHEKHVRLMLDILVLSFWTDSTRISTFMFGNAQTGRNFSFLDGVKGSFHGLSHHREDKKKRNQYEKVGTWHIIQLAYLLEKMDSLKEQDKSLLDNTMVLFGSTIKDGNRHQEEDLPIILAGKGGGAIRPNRRIIAPKETPLCNLYVNMLNNMGIESKQFGDSTGMLKGIS